MQSAGSSTDTSDYTMTTDTRFATNKDMHKLKGNCHPSKALAGRKGKNHTTSHTTGKHEHPSPPKLTTEAGLDGVNSHKPPTLRWEVNR
jgi:hypothetical protein